MLDYFEKFKRQKQLNEGLFDKIFSKDKTPKAQSNGLEIKDGVFIFNGKSRAETINTRAYIHYLEAFDWKNSNLGFLLFPGTQFNAKHLEVDLKKQELLSFKGIWISGPFYGDFFRGTFGQNGTSFKGKFIGPYTNYEADPRTFMSGTFQDTTESGILGMPNTITINGEFNFITIPVGYYFQFRTKNGITGYIKILKRLDAGNSNFKFEVFDGTKNETAPRIIEKTWDEIKMNWNKMTINPASITNIAGLIEINPSKDAVEEVYISSAPSTFKVAPAEQKLEFSPNKAYSYDLSKINFGPNLQIKSLRGENGKVLGNLKPIVEFHFKTQEEFEEFKKIADYIKNGTFSQDVANVKRAVDFGEIDGYGKFMPLSQIFSEPGKNTLSMLPKEPVVRQANIFEEREDTSGILSSMQRLSDFVKYFVWNITKKTGEPNDAIRQLIISRLKNAIFANPKKEINKTNTPTSGSNYGAQPSDFKGSYIKESLRKAVRKIIIDNF